MITVKMLLPLLKGAKAIYLEWNGCTKEIDPKDVLDVDAYGSYVVERISGFEENDYELHIAFQPIKVTEV